MSETIISGFTHPDYENIRVLNQLGGTGDLFAAHKKGLNIDVVIKRTQPRFRNVLQQESEANILKSLKHQYLPRIYDVLYGEDGCLYTVMDLISGQNLQQYIEKNGPVSQKECWRWACQLCEVVQYLHQENREKPAIIHCDIKPGNVMITSSGDICLIDFNTSLIFQEEMEAVGVTDGYAAPEQYHNRKRVKRAEPKPARPPVLPRNETILMETAGSAGAETTLMDAVEGPRGETTLMESSGSAQQDQTTLMCEAQPEAKTPVVQPVVPKTEPRGEYGAISKATDIYAIGATFYYAVTGHTPEKSLEKVTPLRTYDPKISVSLQTILDRAMQKQPRDRFQDAGEMLRALKNVDQMDRGYQGYALRKRVITAALAASFALSAFSTFYGFEQLKLERENSYLLSLAQASQAETDREYENAEQLLESAIQQQPRRAEGYLQIATLYYRLGQYQNAIDRLDAAIASGNLSLKALDASSVEQIYYIKGNCYVELQAYDDAVIQLQNAAAQPGAGTQNYRSLAIALANDGKLEEAQKTLEILRERGASTGDCDLVAAEIKSLKKEYEQAISLYQKVFDEVEDPQLLSHAYLSAADAALKNDEPDRAIGLLEQGRERLNGNQAVLQTEMLADVYIQKAMQDEQEPQTFYRNARDLLQELVDQGYGTISTRMNLATVLQALDQYEAAEKVLYQLIDQYPTDYRFDMQMSYLLIDWQGSLPVEKRDYTEAQRYFVQSEQKYRQAQANGKEDPQMAVLKNLMDQLKTGGWLG